MPNPTRRVHPALPRHGGRNGGGPHSEANAVADVDGGKMDGFIKQRDLARRRLHDVSTTRRASSAPHVPDVMGYHTAAEIPNYWTYAQRLRAR